MSKTFRGMFAFGLGAAVVVGGLSVVVYTQSNPYRKVDGLQAGQGTGRLGVAWPKLPAGRRMGSPAGMDIDKDGESLWAAPPEAQDHMKRRFGVLFQSGALWSSMTLAENVALPLEQYTTLSPDRVQKQVSLKLALVGLAGFEDYYPSQISGGMQKRAGLARAMALDPDILFFDEPSAGLDPISSRLLDELILELRDSLGATVVMVTHELPSIFAIANNSVFLDPETKSQLATGDPHELLAHPPDPKVERFLTRGGSERPGSQAADGPKEATS